MLSSLCFRRLVVRLGCGREFEPPPSREDPDGARGKRFDVSGWLGRCGFEWTSHTGRTKGTCPAGRGGFSFAYENEAA